MLIKAYSTDMVGASHGFSLTEELRDTSQNTSTSQSV